MIPRYCSIKDKGYDCNNPPAYIISIHSNDVYMIGVVCLKHKGIIEQVIKENHADGIIKFEELRYVGTDCISRHLNDRV